MVVIATDNSEVYISVIQYVICVPWVNSAPESFSRSFVLATIDSLSLLLRYIPLITTQVFIYICYV